MSGNVYLGIMAMVLVVVLFANLLPIIAMRGTVVRKERQVGFWSVNGTYYDTQRFLYIRSNSGRVYKRLCTASEWINKDVGSRASFRHAEEVTKW